MTILTAIVLLFSATTFATAVEKITPIIKVAFEKDFITAQHVQWEKTGDFYFASFYLNDVEVNAAYNEMGELVGTSRRIAITQLPLNISLILSKKYSGYTIYRDATEINFEGETKYLVTVTNTKQSLRLKIKTSGEVTVDKKIKNL